MSDFRKELTAHELPFLPGNNFSDPSKERFHVSNSLTFKNGYKVENVPMHPIGGGTIHQSVIKEEEIEALEQHVTDLTVKDETEDITPFVPAHLAYDKKVLKFSGYFKENFSESNGPTSNYRIRFVDIYYYMEDDSISFIEPVIENSGTPQGKLLQRQRLPKDDLGNSYHWTDLNCGIDMLVYGRTYRLTCCDDYTKKFFQSNGIKLNDPEEAPHDPYTESRRPPNRTTKTKSDFDTLKRFLTLDRKVLRFYAVWDDRDMRFGEMRPFIFHYFLVDDTLQIREVHTPNDERDPFPVLLQRQRVQIDRYDIPDTFPSCIMEVSDAEVQGKWLTASDFKIGKTLTISNRRFLIYECDEFTRQWYRTEMNFEQPEKIEIPVESNSKKARKMIIPPYNGFGSIDDTVQNCLSLVPQPPKKDFIKMLENDNKTLRYAASMVPIRPEDKNRRFIITYRLADHMITIYEPPIKNTGIMGGKFLEATRIPKPNCGTVENPVFYGPVDLSIGAMITVFRHRFTIEDCDDFVLSYLEENKEIFPTIEKEQLEKTIESIKDKKL
jgi:hypothetical protein